jgi:hypothetical protein
MKGLHIIPQDEQCRSKWHANLNDGELCFGKDHSGRCYCCVKNSKKIRVQNIFMPKGVICDLEDLELSDENPSEQALHNQENYARVSLIQFYPFWDCNIFSLNEDECFWDKMMHLM